MKRKEDKLAEMIIKQKETIEELKATLYNKDMFISDNYPTIDNFEVKQGWHGAGTATYRVTIHVMAEDLRKLILYFTHKSLRTKKWTHIKSEIKEQIRQEVLKEQNIK